jgi:2-polyprenyl-3-methyl-5-hydroxy-6-metoxy-1,4-benzoquinol methylase
MNYKDYLLLRKFGRDGGKGPVFRENLNGEYEKNKDIIKKIEEHEANYHDANFKGILEKNINELKLSQYLIGRLTSPDSRKIHWVEYAFYLLGNIEGKRVCDFCCGHGEMSVYLAKCGAYVDAFDVSEIGVECVKKLAQANNVKDQVAVKVRSAYKTEYPSGYFDAVLAAGALHHLHLPYALEEIKRILKPGGKLVFLEPIVSHPLMEFIKWKTPLNKLLTLRTATLFEESLNEKDLLYIMSKFSNVEMDRFRFFTRLEGKLHDNQEKIYRLYKADYIMFKLFPFMKHFASAVVGVAYK